VEERHRGFSQAESTDIFPSVAEAERYHYCYSIDLGIGSAVVDLRLRYGVGRTVMRIVEER